MKNRRRVYFFHENKPESSQFMKPLHQLLTNFQFEEVQTAKDADIIISVGGDGTFLQAVRKTGFRPDCLYAGISTTNELKMYCDFHIHDLDTLATALSNNQFEIRKYPTIEVSLDHQPPFLCLNDLSIRSSIIKTLTLDVIIDELPFETFRGDGIIISTPKGSTAYSKATGGAVIDPSIPCLQVNELASLNNHMYRTLGSSFILSANNKLTIRILNISNCHPIIALDNEAVSTRNVERIEAKLSHRVIKAVKMKNHSFWEKVKLSYQL
ncbi:MAG: NAD kinase [Bacillus sp. (in: firmicutes)]